MDKERRFDTPKAQDFILRFPRIVDMVANSINRPFRPRGVINSAVLEAVMVTLLNFDFPADAQLSDRYETLLGKKEFLSLITGGTTDTLVVKNRLNIAKEVLIDGAS